MKKQNLTNRVMTIGITVDLMIDILKQFCIILFIWI